MNASVSEKVTDGFEERDVDGWICDERRAPSEEDVSPSEGFVAPSEGMMSPSEGDVLVKAMEFFESIQDESSGSS